MRIPKEFRPAVLSDSSPGCVGFPRTLSRARAIRCFLLRVIMVRSSGNGRCNSERFYGIGQPALKFACFAFDTSIYSNIIKLIVMQFRSVKLLSSHDADALSYVFSFLGSLFLSFDACLNRSRNQSPGCQRLIKLNCAYCFVCMIKTRVAAYQRPSSYRCAHLTVCVRDELCTLTNLPHAQALQQTGLSKTEIKDLFENADTSGDDAINLEEFMELMESTGMYST